MAFNITYILDGGVNNPGNPATFVAGDLPITLLDPTKSGYTFDGWLTVPGFPNIPQPITEITEEEDVSVEATWSQVPGAVSYILNGGTNNPGNPDVLVEGDLPTTLLDPTREGYTFVNWTYVDESGEIPVVTPITEFTVFERIEVTANWTVNTYTITYDSNGGSAVTDTDFDYGETVTLPADPTKAGLHFNGWFTDVELTIPYTPDTMPAENFTLYAAWYAIVSYDVDGGSAVPSENVSETNSPSPVEDPTKEGYAFTGWFEEDTLTTPFDFDLTSITEDTVIYAGWTVIYDVTYVLNYGTNNVGNPDTFIASDLPITLLAPTRLNYVFTGWFTDEALTTEVTEINAEADITLYAGWSFDSTIIGNFVDIPIYKGSGVMVNRNYIAQVIATRDGNGKYRIQLIISPGTLYYIKGVYTTYEEAVAVRDDFLDFIGIVTIDGGVIA